MNGITVLLILILTAITAVGGFIAYNVYKDSLKTPEKPVDESSGYGPWGECN